MGPVFAGGLLVGRIMIRSKTDAPATGCDRSATMKPLAERSRTSRARRSGISTICSDTGVVSLSPLMILV